MIKYILSGSAREVPVHIFAETHCSGNDKCGHQSLHDDPYLLDLGTQYRLCWGRHVVDSRAIFHLQLAPCILSLVASSTNIAKVGRHTRRGVQGPRNLEVGRGSRKQIGPS